nr:uncharacterized mitochondrial protein AtMg00810-like [Tanacetum cinerariifolium]
MHAVKRIFRYLKGQPTLGLWYPKDSPLELTTYSDSDYAGPSLDRKSTPEGCQFLGSKLISWQCKKQTIVANSTTETKYIAASNCYGQKKLMLLDTLLLEKKLMLGKPTTLCLLPPLFLKTHNIMSTPTFAKTHNFIAFLEKSSESDGFEQIVDFLNVNQIKYALTVSPTIYTLYIKQFWTTLEIKTVNDDFWLQALFDGKKVVITEASIRHDLQLNDAEGTSCLPNAVIFEELARMGIIASAIICLANNQKFNFSKYILDNLKKNSEAGYPSTCFLGTRFSRVVTLLFRIMMVQAVKEEGDLPTTVQDTPIPDALSSSQPQRKHKPRRKEMKETEVSPTELPTEDPVPTTSNDPLLSGEENANIDADAEVNLENVYNLDMVHKETVLSMHDATDADGKEVAKEMVEVISTVKIIVDEVSTVGGELNDANEKPVSIAPTNITTAQPSEATKTTIDITTASKAKGIVFHDVEESTTRTASSKVQVKDKGKAKLVEEPEVLKSRKAQITIDEEVARRIEIKPMFEEEYNKVQTLFKEGLEMDAERIKAPRNRTRKEKVEKDQTATKQKGNELEKENAKKQKIEEQQDTKELKRNLEIVRDDEDDVFVNVAPLSCKPLTILDYNIYKEGKKEHFQIVRVNGNHQMYLAFSRILKNFDREDLEVLWKIVKDKFKESQPKEVLDVFL